MGSSLSMKHRIVSTVASLIALAIGAFLMTSDSAGAAPTPSNSIKTLKAIYAFQGPPSYPNSLLLGGDGNFYGTTQLGGAGGHGTLYRLDPLGNLQTLREFSGGPGAYPSMIALSADGRLYGGSAGSNGDGLRLSNRNQRRLSAAA